MAKASKEIKIAEKKEGGEKTSIKGAAGAALNSKKGFDLNDFKKSKNLSQSAKFKPDQWLPLSPAFNEAISAPGILHGHITLFRGHSDTGKTTAMIEAMIAFQKAGILPVIIITEMKWNWERAIRMGFQVEREIDEETGEVNYTGEFIYVDRSKVNTIEDVAAFIADLLDHQKKGQLPYDLAFFWDSVGSVASKQSWESNSNNAMWNAGAMSTQFANFINQEFTKSRKADSKYTNSFIVVNKIRIEYPIGNPMEKPKMRNKCGDAMYWDATFVITFGNIVNAGTAKLKAKKNGKEYIYGHITKITVDKNHKTDSTSISKVVMTPYGFIRNTDAEINAYKKAHAHEWLQELGTDSVEGIQFEQETASDEDFIRPSTIISDEE